MPESQMDRQLTEEELATMPEIVNQLNKAEGEPVYQREIFQLLVSKAMGEKIKI